MKVAEVRWNKFYAKLGFLCYAIAFCDEKITKPEIAALKELVKKEWLDLEETEDAFGSDAAYQIEILFDWLEENIPPTEYAFEEFSDFAKEHEDFFTPQLKRKVYKTANKIAAAYAGKNKDERDMIHQLHKLLGPL